jgi:glyoxalase family protein
MQEEAMRKIQTQGVHHITLIGAARQTSIDFWEGVLGMPFIFEQPNLDVPEESHLYFDPGDGRLITVFTDERRKVDPTRNPEGIGNLHHIAFTVSHATYTQIARRLDERGISNTGEVDRGFMNSLYFRDPLGQLLELACYKFEPPIGATHADVLREAHLLRVARGDHHIADEHLTDAIELLTVRRQGSLSGDRTAKDPYTEKPPVWG